MSKKYFWLKLNVDFFEREEVKLIENMPNGKEYIIFYVKLLLKSANSDGKLLFKDVIPYTEDMLATVTGINVDVVRTAVKLFLKLGLMQKLSDGALFMLETQKMIGCETEYAKKKREYREKKKVEAIEDKSGTKKDIVQIGEKTKKDIEKTDDDIVQIGEKTKKDNVLQEIEKEIDIEIEREKDIREKEKENSLTHSQSIKEKFSNLLLMIAQATKTTVHQVSLQINPMEIIDRLDDYIEAINQSEYLQGKSSTLPVIRNYTQVDKVLSGFYKTYDNKSNSKLDVNDVEFAERDDHIEF